MLFQTVVMLLATGVALVFGWTLAVSVFVGGLASLLPNAVFAWQVFAPYRAQQPGQLVVRFYAAELVKLLFTALIFVAAFLWLTPINVAALFIAFFVVQVISPLLAHKYLD